MSSEVSIIRIESTKGKGRTVISTQPLKAGQIILTDSPILIYPSFSNNNYIYCSNCYVIITVGVNNNGVTCDACSAPFCGLQCRAEAAATSHTPWACHALRSLGSYPNWDRYPEEFQSNNNSVCDNPNGVMCDTCLTPFCGLQCRTEAAATCHTAQACWALWSLWGYLNWDCYPEEFQIQARFLIAAYNLAIVSPSGFRTLLSLQGERSEKEGDESGATFILHSLVSLLCQVPNGLGVEFCLELTAALLAKDKINAFGLMEPFSPSSEQNGEQRQRSVRAYGIYPNASLFNHDCLPNACRFDYIDQKNRTSSSSKNNTDIVIRMIHDVPEGREICLSYFPVNLNYRERQIRLRDDYGFVCTCDRCRVEANWSDDDEDDVAMDEVGGEDDTMEAGDELDDEEDGSNMVNEGGEGENDDFPHAYFFLRYMCTQQDCWGTLAPLPTPPSSNGTTMTLVMECNVCGNLKKDEQEVTDCQP